MCICLIFNTIPENLQIGFLGGSLSSKLIIYLLIIGFIYTGYCQYKYKNVFVNLDNIKKYIIVFLFINIISLLIGLYNYPYYDQILNAPINQIEKLPKLLKFLQEVGINIGEQTLLIIWIAVRFLKNLLLETIYTFGGAYMIYCWYYNNIKDGIKILLEAILYSIILILLYNIIEVFYLAGNTVATSILIYITPFFHSITTEHNWWPPLLWRGQLRSIFAEPSFLGIYAAFAMPFLWYKVIKSPKYVLSYIVLNTLFVFSLFLTQSRTAVALFIGEIILLIIGVIYLKCKVLFKKLFIILCCSIISFISANLFITNIMTNNEKTIVNNSIGSYLEDNVGSLTSINERSNMTRYSTIIANFKIGIDYPLLGVGLGLSNAYMPNYFPEMSKNNNEINMWIENQQKEGILKSGFPNLCEYSIRFAETGLLGLLVFLFAPYFLLIQLLKKVISIEGYNEKLLYIIFIISFIGTLTAAIGSSISTTYCYWALLGLGYAICFGKPGDDIKNE